MADRRFPRPVPQDVERQVLLKRLRDQVRTGTCLIDADQIARAMLRAAARESRKLR